MQATPVKTATKMDMSLDDVIKAAKKTAKPVSKAMTEKTPKDKVAARKPKNTPKKATPKGKSAAGKGKSVQSPARGGKQQGKQGKELLAKAVTASASANRQAKLAKKRGLNQQAQVQVMQRAKRAGAKLVARSPVQVFKGKGKGLQAGRAKAVVVAAARRQQGSANRLRPTQRAFKPAPVPLEPMKIKIVNNAAPANQPQKRPIAQPIVLPRKQQLQPQQQQRQQRQQQRQLQQQKLQKLQMRPQQLQPQRQPAVYAKPKAQAQGPRRRNKTSLNLAAAMQHQGYIQQNARRGLPAPKSKAMAQGLKFKPVPSPASTRPIMPGQVLAMQNSKNGKLANLPLGVRNGGVAKGGQGQVRTGGSLNQRFAGRGGRR